MTVEQCVKRIRALGGYQVVAVMGRLVGRPCGMAGSRSRLCSKGASCPSTLTRVESCGYKSGRALGTPAEITSYSRAAVFRPVVMGLGNHCNDVLISCSRRKAGPQAVTARCLRAAHTHFLPQSLAATRGAISSSVHCKPYPPQISLRTVGSPVTGEGHAQSRPHAFVGVLIRLHFL